MVTSAVYVLVSGLLSIQISGLRAGAVYDLWNKVVAITPPQLPLFQMAAAAALTGLMFYVVLQATKRLARTSRIGFLSAVLGGNLLLIVFGMTMLRGSEAETLLVSGIDHGVKGWLIRASTDPAVHGLTLLTAGTLWMVARPTAPRPSRREVEQAA